MANEIFRKP